jgi:hypothetical protein
MKSIKPVGTYNNAFGTPFSDGAAGISHIDCITNTYVLPGAQYGICLLGNGKRFTGKKSFIYLKIWNWSDIVLKPS